jgi:hypothetical protein
MGYEPLPNAKTNVFFCVWFENNRIIIHVTDTLEKEKRLGSGYTGVEFLLKMALDNPEMVRRCL